MTVIQLRGNPYRPIMKPSERFDALRPSLEREAEEAERLRPVTLEQLERAEQAVRDGGGGPMFSEMDTYADFHFGMNIPTGVVGEVQSGDDMAGDTVVDERTALHLRQAVAVFVLVAWAVIVWGVGAACGWW